MTNYEPGAWHQKVIPASTEATLCSLRDAHLLERFYLAGGTGLALHFGHRLSLDLDFFAPEQFNEESFVQQLQMLEGFALATIAPYTLHATLDSTKVSFLGYAYPVLFPASPFLGVSVADPRDIACMKLSAIASRGTKRDFVDLYACAQRFGLEEILLMFDTKYSQTHYSRIHLLKSLTYFADAEKDPMPHMLEPIAWSTMVQYFSREVPRLI